MPTPNPSPNLPVAKPAAPLFALHYASGAQAQELLTDNGSILGVIGYGASRPEYLPAGCAFAAAPLMPQDGAPKFEIWMARSPCRPLGTGPVIGAVSDDLAFGAIILQESENAPLEAVVERAYSGIFDFMAAAGCTAPIRFWNYLTAITADDRGLERYRRFNIGRQKAFSARLAQALPPAASGVGGFHGHSLIYFLAARKPASPIENPRQVSAYQYPKIYGPQSPSFSRAAMFSLNGTRALFISGTASIVGHETRHVGDLPAQLAETIANLRALIGAAGPMPQTGRWMLKIYLQNPEFRETVEPAIDAMFGAATERLYLLGEICRTGLLLEMEAFHIDQQWPDPQDAAAAEAQISDGVT